MKRSPSGLSRLYVCLASLILVFAACAQVVRAEILPQAAATPSATPSATPGRLVNISTRAAVGTGQRVVIAGFITSAASKDVVVRGLGPSLQVGGQPIPGRLVDPFIELFDSARQRIAFNDDWKTSQRSQIEATNLAPSADAESAILRTLDATTYTVTLRGNNNGSGIGLVEVYDLGSTPESRLLNLSTRAFVGTDSSVLIAGFIVGNTGSLRLIVRLLGPSLTDFGIVDPLADPTLQLFDANGVSVGMNNNWQDDQRDELARSGLAPTRTTEAALITILPPGNFTAVARGVGATSGTALLEVYDVPEPLPMQ